MLARSIARLGGHQCCAGGWGGLVRKGGFVSVSLSRRRFVSVESEMGQIASAGSVATKSSGADANGSKTHSGDEDARFTSQRMLDGSSSPDASVEDLRLRVVALEEENRRIEQRLEFETVARTRAEILVRERFVEATSGGVGAMRPVGKISTCFPSRFGTPRQGSLASGTRGVITLDPSVVGGGALNGLDGFSHVWVVFIFHENTNMHKFVSNQGSIFPSFVRPPQGGGKRVGLFSTRTPHRPNPVGLSLARLDRVDEAKGQVHLRGVDLIDGTPIVDIKPFVPHVDSPQVEEGKIRVPKWVVNPKFDVVPVQFAEGVATELRAFVSAGECEWFAEDEADDFLSTLEQVITLDPRGVIHGRGHYKGDRKGKCQTKKKKKDGTDAAIADGGANTNADAAQLDEEALTKREKPKAHLFRDNFVLDFDALRIAFRPHEERRAIIVHAVELKRAKNPNNKAFNLRKTSGNENDRESATTSASGLE